MSRKTIAIIEILLCSTLWSIAGIFIKLIPWSGFAIGSLRSLLAGIVAFICLKMWKMRFTVTGRSVAGGIALGLTMTFFCMANKMTTAANAIVLQSTAPIFIVIFSALFFGKRFRKADIIVVAIAFCGIAMFFFDRIGAGTLKGNLVGLASGVTFGSYYISLEGSPDDERMSAVIIGHSVTFLIGLPFVFITQPEFTLSSVVCIIILGVVQLGIPYVLLARGSGYCPPLVCSLLGTLEPLLNPVWVFIFDGEAPGPFALAGGAVVIVSISAWCVYNAKHEAVRV